MATPQENLERFREISRRGLQDQLPQQVRARFDEAVNRGLIQTQQAPQQETREQAIQRRTQALRDRGAVSGPPSRSDPLSTQLFGQAPMNLTPDEKKGVVELAATFASGAAAEPIAGIAGIASIPFVGLEGSGDVVESVRDKLTYSPESRSAREALSSEPVQAVGRAVESVERGAGDIAYRGARAMGAPDELQAAAGAVGSAVPAALAEIFALKGSRSMKRAALKEQLRDTPEAFTPEDELKPEVQRVVEQQGFSPDEIRPSETPSGEGAFDVGQAERRQRFEEFGARPTRGDLTQRLEDQKPERMLMESTEDPSGQAFRAQQLEKDMAIQQSVRDTVEDLGVPSETAQSIREALSTRKSMLEEQRQQAYEQLSESQQANDIPIMSNNLLEGLPDRGDVRTIASLNRTPFKSLSELLVEFGVDSDPRVIKNLERQGVDITPLSLKNFEGFRRRLNKISEADPSGQMEVVINPIRRNLDDEVSLATKTLEESASKQIGPPVQRGVDEVETEEIFRAHTGDKESEVTEFTSWTPERETAEAYTDNPGFGGDKIRAAKVNTENTLDVASPRGVDFEKLARELGYDNPVETAREWSGNGWRYPWEESGRIRRKLKDSGFDWVKYEDDFPDGATTLVPLKNIQLSEKTGNPNVSELAKNARQSHIALTTEFDEKAMTEELLAPKKRGSDVPKIEDSKVYQTIASRSTTPEQVDRLITSLEKSPKGGRAIGNLQSAMMLDLLDSSLKATTRKISGVPTIGGSALQKQFSKLEPKIDIVFRNNPSALKRVKNFNKIAEDITPPNEAMPKGSAGVMIDLVNRLGLGRITGGDILAGSLRTLGRARSNRNALRRAMKDPQVANTAKLIQSDYPTLASVLGIGEALSEPQRQEEQQ